MAGGWQAAGSPSGFIVALVGNAARFARLVLLVAAAALLSACSEKVDLQTGLRDAEANEMISELNRKGIEAYKRTNKEGVVVSVNEKEISRATEVLAAAGLPRRNLSSLGQMFKREGMISTPLEERARYIHGLSAELEYTLQQFDRVISARVHVVLPERVAPGEPIQPSSAAVFAKYRPPLDEDVVVPRIRNLVAASIPGLSGEAGRSKVSVVLMASELEAPAAQWTYVGPFRVLSDSAGWLRGVLFILVMLAGIGLTLAGMNALKRNPVLAERLRKSAARVRTARHPSGAAPAGNVDASAADAKTPGTTPTSSGNAAAGSADGAPRATNP